MLEHFFIMEGSRKVALFQRDSVTGKYAAELLDKSGRFPIVLFGFYGERSVADPDMVDYWVRTRVYPKNRQNISDILQQLGLTEYDPWKLFLAVNGRNTDDAYYIKRVD